VANAWFNLTHTRENCQTKYDNYMVIGDVNYDLLCLIINTRDKCLTKYDKYIVIGNLNNVLLVIGHKDVIQITYHNVFVIFISQTFVTNIGDWTL
jgi:hypothetical protein